MDIFISYSHKDHAWKERVGLFMQCMRRQGHFDYNTWDDGEINISEEWERRIEEAISKAKIAVLLISPDFLTSRFISEKELPIILKKKSEGLLSVVPVIVRPSPWEVVDWLAPIQLHPPGGQALSGGSEHQIEEHLKSLAIEVHRLLNQSKQSAPSPSVEGAPMTDTQESKPYVLMGEEEVKKFIHRRFSEIAIQSLLLYEVKEQQRVWVVATRSNLYCIIDSRTTSEADTNVQWVQAIEPNLTVLARSKSRLPGIAGTVDIGKKQNWLYSLNLYPDPKNLSNAISTMIEKALRS